ncbi:FAD/NAD(P)-binding protein [Actinokineospora sp. NPDC004072]
MRPGRRRRVVIVGAGLAGTATAIRLLQFAREAVEVVVVERRPGFRNAGVAHHPESNHWHHVFNIQAGRMSVFREDVDDFIDWANREADRTGWPAEWKGFTFVESGPAPRRIYPEYLADRLAQAAREALPGVVLVEGDGEVVDVEVHEDHVDVVVEDFSVVGGETKSGRVALRADHVVLATGLERKSPTFAADVVGHPAFVPEPYSAAGLERILSARRDDVVAIVGSLLSAYDAATLLLRRGHTGTIHMISRSGLTLRTYPPDHRHQVIDLPTPRFFEDGPYGGREEFVLRFTEEWERACAAVAREHPEVSPAVVTERVFKAWEPHLPAILARIPTPDLRALLDRYGSLLAMLRVGVMPYTADLVNSAVEAGGPVVVTAGRVEGIRATEAGRLVVTVSGRTTGIEADLVISNFGRESDYGRVGSALWRNLLRKGLACPHRRTGRGVEVDERGRLVGAAGTPSRLIAVVGHPREGDEIVRNGRLGAFSFNLAAIKNHSVEVAATILCQLESCYDMATTPPGARDQGWDEALAYSTMLDVRRMTARRQDHRQALVARLEDSLRELAARGGDDAVPAPVLRFAVTSAATEKLKDLSVTPRELRAALGLGRRLEAIG